MAGQATAPLSVPLCIPRRSPRATPPGIARKPEDFESIARRYIEHPTLIDSRLKIGCKLQALGFMARMLTGVPDLDRWEQRHGHPLIRNQVLAHDDEAWRATAERQALNLLPITSK